MQCQGSASTTWMIRRLVFCILVVGCGVVHAQYPSRSVLFVVPYSAASDADLSARHLAQQASQYLGQSIVVLNQPGASGSIGTVTVRDAPPDGYRLLLARLASQVILPAIDTKTPYKANDFTYLSLLEMNPFVCAVKGDARYASMKDLVADIRANPGKLNFGTVGEGTIQNFGPQYLFSLLKMPKEAAVGIPYKGSGELVAALVGGHVQFACSNLGTMLGQFRAGTLRPLMTATRQRLKELPDVPTARSLGWPEMENLAGWAALAGPPHLPREIVQRWSDVMAKLARDPAWVGGTEKLGAIPAVRNPAETERFVRDQYHLYERLAVRLGVRQ